jgi:hypothetical protein
MLVIFIRALVVALVPAAAFAQSFTGTIAGTVKDASGAVVPGVTVTLMQLETGRQAVVITTNEGRYVSGPLAVGTYRVEASLTGFRSAVRTKIDVHIQETAIADFTLDVGSVSEQVEVQAAAAPIETASSSLSKLVDNRRIAELPLNTRNVYGLIFLTPGVAGTIGNNYNSMSYTVNGARPTMMDTVIDGLTASFPTVNGFTGISVFPSVDAIEEFKVMGANYPAEFGRSLGSVLNVVYKSGTNQAHGSAYEFLRNSIFDANNFFENRRGNPLASFKRSQFGGTASGPIRHGRTFFMASYEGLRERSFRNRVFTVPTLLERQGDFSQSFAANGQLIRIFNPFTTRPAPGGTGFIRDPFADNKIPASLFDSVAMNVLKYYPVPNQPGDAVTGRNNYSESGSQAINTDNYDVRVDEQISDRQKFFLRYSYRLTENIPPVLFPKDIGVAEGRINEENHAHNVVMDYTHTLSPRTVLTARLGFARTLFVFANQGLGFVPSSLGLPKTIDAVVDRQMFPRFGAGGFVDLGGNDHRRNAFNSYSAVAGLTKMRDHHTFKVGFDGRMLRVNVWEARSAGTFNFSPGFTQGPDPTRASSTAGHSIASLLLGTGTPVNVLIQGWKNVASQSFYLAGYVQDDWRPTSRLTLNLGVRYDIDTPRTERYNRMNYFDPTARSPLADRVPQFPDLRGGVVFVGVDGRSRHQYHWDTNNVAPRLGVAYQITPRTVLRAAYGHIFGPSNQAAQGTVGPFGFRTEYPWVTTLDNVTPFNLLRDPYPQGFRALPGASDGLLTQVGANLQAPLQDTPAPWSQQWNINIQRELPWQTAIEIAYVGTRGHDLALSAEGGYNLNQLDPKYQALGPALNQLVDNPFFGIVNNGVLAAPRISRAQLLRPYPQFTDIVPLYWSGASSSYNALQMTVSKRMSNGIQLEGSYAWAKAMDEGMMHQNSYDIHASRSLASYDIGHRFVVSYLYELPFGRGRTIGAGAPRTIQFLIGGWQLNGITTIQSGTPLSISASNTAGLFNPVTRPNRLPRSAELSGRAQDRLSQYFDTSVFSQPPPFTFGNVGPTISDVRADSVRNTDLALLKTFSAGTRARVQFRVEALNAWNRPQFEAPDTSVNSPSFGVIRGQANTPRQLQFALKILW